SLVEISSRLLALAIRSSFESPRVGQGKARLGTTPISWRFRDEEHGRCLSCGKQLDEVLPLRLRSGLVSIPRVEKDLPIWPIMAVGLSRQELQQSRVIDRQRRCLTK